MVFLAWNLGYYQVLRKTLFYVKASCFQPRLQVLVGPGENELPDQQQVLICSAMVDTTTAPMWVIRMVC